MFVLKSSYSKAHLKPQHLAAFSHLSSDPRAKHYCRVIQRRPGGHADRTRVRNHRYAALRALQKGKLFCHPVDESAQICQISLEVAV